MITFKKSRHGAAIQTDDIKYLFNKALETKLKIEKILGEKKKRVKMIRVSEQSIYSDKHFICSGWVSSLFAK
eukprot:14322568-Ditylum_brightwellii.AAC.1